CCFNFLFFSSRRRHTRSKRDWSSDVCSSDLTINSKVDSALAGALELVNMDTVPVMSIITGHGEMLSTSNMAAFVDNMEQNNFQRSEERRVGKEGKAWR